MAKAELSIPKNVIVEHNVEKVHIKFHYNNSNDGTGYFYKPSLKISHWKNDGCKFEISCLDKQSGKKCTITFDHNATIQVFPKDLADDTTSSLRMLRFELLTSFKPLLKKKYRELIDEYINREWKTNIICRSGREIWQVTSIDCQKDKTTWNFNIKGICNKQNSKLDVYFSINSDGKVKYNDGKTSGDESIIKCVKNKIVNDFKSMLDKYFYQGMQDNNDVSSCYKCLMTKELTTEDDDVGSNEKIKRIDTIASRTGKYTCCMGCIPNIQMPGAYYSYKATDPDTGKEHVVAYLMKKLWLKLGAQQSNVWGTIKKGKLPKLSFADSGEQYIEIDAKEMKLEGDKLFWPSQEMYFGENKFKISLKVLQELIKQDKVLVDGTRMTTKLWYTIHKIINGLSEKDYTAKDTIDYIFKKNFKNITEDDYAEYGFSNKYEFSKTLKTPLNTLARSVFPVKKAYLMIEEKTLETFECYDIMKGKAFTKLNGCGWQIWDKTIDSIEDAAPINIVAALGIDFRGGEGNYDFKNEKNKEWILQEMSTMWNGIFMAAINNKCDVCEMPSIGMGAFLDRNKKTQNKEVARMYFETCFQTLSKLLKSYGEDVVIKRLYYGMTSSRVPQDELRSIFQEEIKKCDNKKVKDIVLPYDGDVVALAGQLSKKKINSLLLDTSDWQVIFEREPLGNECFCYNSGASLAAEEEFLGACSTGSISYGQLMEPEQILSFKEAFKPPKPPKRPLKQNDKEHSPKPVKQGDKEPIINANFNPQAKAFNKEKCIKITGIVLLSLLVFAMLSGLILAVSTNTNLSKCLATVHRQ